MRPIAAVPMLPRKGIFRYDQIVPMRRMLQLGNIFLAAWLCAVSGCKREAPVQPATQPATQATTVPATRPVLADYVELLRQHDSKVPATKPLGVPVDLEDAGHFVLSEPVFLDGRGDLWITHADGRGYAEIFKKASEEQIHIVRETVKFAWWFNDDEGKLLVRIVAQKPDGTQHWALPDGATAPLTRDKYRWNDALFFGTGVAVPTERGVAVFNFQPEYGEQHYDLTTSNDLNPPRILLDARGLLAWCPWEGSKKGSDGAWRLVDRKWSNLTQDAKWPQKIIHLVPLLDGSVLQLLQGEEGKLGLALSSLDNPEVDEKAIEALVIQLSDDDPEKREAAYRELTRYGVASWPVLEKLVEDQPPEARFRIEALLKDRIQPTLGGKTLVDGKAFVADRFADGGVLLHAPAGVTIPSLRDDKPGAVVKPAWISIRPGRAIELLEPVLTKGADPAKQNFFAFGEEWLVSDATTGPRRLLGNHVEPMLRKEEAQYAHIVGFDPRGRWLFKTSPDAKETLIVDPTVPDTTPRLPVWLLVIEKGTTGWSNGHWPAINRGGQRNSWMLREHGWSALDERKDKVNTVLPKSAPLPRVAIPPPPPADDVATSKPATTRTTAPAATTTVSTTSVATTSPTEPPILIDSEGRKYYDGRRTLLVIDRDGKEVSFTLPANAVGDDGFDVVLIRTEDGKLFLFNAPGRVVRISPNDAKEIEPFKVDAVFTNRIPSEKIRRIWLDPAGRIVIAYGENRIAFLFPGGRIPSAMAKLMLASEKDQKP